MGHFPHRALSHLGKCCQLVEAGSNENAFVLVVLHENAPRLLVILVGGWQVLDEVYSLILQTALQVMELVYLSHPFLSIDHGKEAILERGPVYVFSAEMR